MPIKRDIAVRWIDRRPIQAIEIDKSLQLINAMISRLLFENNRSRDPGRRLRPGCIVFFLDGELPIRRPFRLIYRFRFRPAERRRITGPQETASEKPSARREQTKRCAGDSSPWPCLALLSCRLLRGARHFSFDQAKVDACPRRQANIPSRRYIDLSTVREPDAPGKAR